MTYRKTILLILCGIFLAVGCSSMSIEERFNYRNLGTDLTIKSVEFSYSEYSVFKFTDSELRMLENEIDKFSIFDISDQDLNRLQELSPDVTFAFSDGFMVSFASYCGEVNNDIIWNLSAPDDAGFNGALTILVRLNYVLTDKRIEEFRKKMKKKENQNSVSNSEPN